MVRMLPTLLLTLSSPAISFRLATENVAVGADAPTCACSETGVVDGVTTNKPGCAQHFGTRFGYICYVDNGAECPGSRLSSRTGVYWRSCRAEHLTSEARIHLMEAMENMDLDILRGTIGVAEQRGVDPELLAAAHAREEVVVQMVAAREELMGALRAFSAERLQAALETAEELELDEFLSEETLENAVARFQFLEQRDEAAAALRTAIQGDLLTVVQDALHEAKVKHCDDDVIRMGETRVAELEAEIAAADEELAAAVLTRDAARVQAAKENCERLVAVDADRIEAAAARLAHLTRMDAAVAVLREAVAAADLHDLEGKLQRARELDAYPDDLQQGDDRVVELTQQNLDAEAALIAATADHNIAALEAALAEADRLTGGTILASNIQSGETRLADLHRRGEAHEELEIAMEDVDLMVLRQKIARAQDLGLFVQSPEVLTRANARIDEIQDMMADATSVLAAAVVAEHDGTHLATENLVSALAEVERLHCVRDWDQVTDATISNAEARLARLREIDQATDDVIAIYDSDDMHQIIMSLAHARTVGVVQPVIDRGEEAAQRVRILLRDTRQNLIDLTQGDDIDALQAALDETLRIRAASPRRIQEAEDRLAELRAAAR